MDWTKIKTKYFLFTKMSDREQAALVRLLCLTAHLEKLPDESEMRQVCGQMTLKSLSNHYQSEGKSLQNVLQKVIEDVSKVEKKRERDRSYHKTYDKSRQRDEVLNSSPREDKIREDKRREEYNISETVDLATPIVSRTRVAQKVDLSDIEVDGLSRGSKYKLYNDTLKVFSQRGWVVDADYLKRVLKNALEGVRGHSPKNAHPYCDKAVVNYIATNAELFSADAKKKIWGQNGNSKKQG